MVFASSRALSANSKWNTPVFSNPKSDSHPLSKREREEEEEEEEDYKNNNKNNNKRTR
jgi:hypothetical protein